MACVLFTIYTGATSTDLCDGKGIAITVYIDATAPFPDFTTVSVNTDPTCSTPVSGSFLFYYQNYVYNYSGVYIVSSAPCPTTTPTPTPTVTPTNTKTPTVTPTNTLTQTVTPTNTLTQTVTPTVTPTNTKTPTVTPTNTLTQTVTPTVTPTNTKTPTVTPTNTKTPTVTPTFTPTPSSTPTSDYCVHNTITYDGDYVFGGTYDGYNYYNNTTLLVGFIFYSIPENRWCLAGNLGDSCVEFGAYGNTSSTPDLDDTVMYIGICVTTTTTTNPCANFDFDAIFDCFIQPTPSITPTNTTTPTITPTPSVTSPCGGRSLSASISSISPTPTATPTVTPSSTPVITRPCVFSGEVVFNSINQIIECANSKKFKDCFTGINYFTSGLVLVSGTTSPKEGYVYNATINGLSYCVVFEGLFENISGVDNISLTNEVGPSNLGSCLECTPSLPEPILECVIASSKCGTSYATPGPYINGKLSYTWSFTLPISPQYFYNIYWDNINDRWNATETTTNVLGAYLEIDSELPIGTILEWVVGLTTNPSVGCFGDNFNTTLLNVPCPTLTPTPTLTPSATPCVQKKYRVTNVSPSVITVQYTTCVGGSPITISLAGFATSVVCSSTVPVPNNPQNTFVIPLGFVC